jgi:Domain of Unknown Function (DUF1080)
MSLPTRCIVAACCLALLASGRIPAEDKPPSAVIDAKDAGPDFAYQGEYSSDENTINGTKVKSALQVIAHGGGKFHVVSYAGGLPGDGWDKNRAGLKRTDGELKNGQVEVPVELFLGVVKQGRFFLRDLQGNDLMVFQKIERKSPTLGAKPPKGAVVLFDGSSVDAFENGRTTADGLLMVGTRTKQAFGDFLLHAEFRLPYMPDARGQGRANSGIYLQDRYEIQVLDSFGLEGKDNECGGFYQQRDPDENMCLPPLAWQTYDIDFAAARFDAQGKKTANAKVTVRHNGVVIHAGFELPGPTPGGKEESADGGALQFQDHGNPVHYSNIWVLEKK